MRCHAYPTCLSRISSSVASRFDRTKNPLDFDSYHPPGWRREFHKMWCANDWRSFENVFVMSSSFSAVTRAGDRLPTKALPSRHSSARSSLLRSSKARSSWLTMRESPSLLPLP